MTPAGVGNRNAPALDPALLTMLELNGVNGFTGAVIVTEGRNRGTLYFSEGRLVHAVAGIETGEIALRLILTWPKGEYLLDSDVLSPRSTITRGLDELIADARGQQPPRAEQTGSHARPSPAAPAGGRRAGLAEIAEQARRIPGVVCAVLHDPSGTPIGAGPLDPLEEEALCLSRLAKGLGGILDSGPLVLGVVHGATRNVLLLTSKERQLTILIQAGSLADSAQAQIRKLLGAQP